MWPRLGNHTNDSLAVQAAGCKGIYGTRTGQFSIERCGTCIASVFLAMAVMSLAAGAVFIFPLAMCILMEGLDLF